MQGIIAQEEFTNGGQPPVVIGSGNLLDGIDAENMQLLDIVERSLCIDPRYHEQEKHTDEDVDLVTAALLLQCLLHRDVFRGDHNEFRTTRLSVAIAGLRWEWSEYTDDELCCLMLEAQRNKDQSKQSTLKFIIQLRDDERVARAKSLAETAKRSGTWDDVRF